jgi:hypothetical protein
MNFHKKLVTLALGLTLMDVGFSHPVHDGEELGASVRFIPGSDMQVNVTVRPVVSFDRVSVELGSNAVGGGKVVCEMGAVVAKQIYRCVVSGDVPDHDPGLVINVIGYSSSAEHDIGISRKNFTISNPTYDRVADQLRQRQMIEKSSRNATLREPSHGEPRR